MRGALLGLLALVLATFAAPAAAVGTASGQVTGIDGVLYDDCRYVPYLYEVAVPSDAGYWDLSTTLLGPDGLPTAGDYIAMPTSGTGRFGLLCPPGDSYGTYTIRSTIRWGTDQQSLGDPVALVDAHFTLRKPYTRTALSVSTRRPAYGQRVTCRIRVRDERPEGYLPTPFAWVHLEKRVDGRWVRVKGSRTLTHSTGRVKVPLRYLRRHHQRMRIRAVAETAPRFRRSASPVVRLW